MKTKIRYTLALLAIWLGTNCAMAQGWPQNYPNFENI